MVRLDGQNIEEVYGLYPDRGFDDQLLPIAAKKKGYEYEWPGEDGIETDPNEVPVFQRLTYTLPFTMKCEGFADFQSKYNLLKEKMLTSKEMNLDVPRLNRRFKVRYANMTSFEKLSATFHLGRFGIKIILQFTDDYPRGFTLGTPDVPTLNDITLNGSGNAVLSWVEGNAGDSAKQGNRIQRRLVGGSWGDLVVTNGTGTSYTDTTNQAGASYEYRVATRNAQGYSAYSNMKSLIDLTPPYVAPTATVSIVGGNVKENVGPTWEDTIQLAWSVSKGSKDITSIVVGGVTVPANGGSQSGTVNVNITGNRTAAFTMQVSDGQQTVSKSTSTISRQNRIYWGWYSGWSFNDLTTRESQIRTNRLLTTNYDTGGQHMFFYFPVSWGSPTFWLDDFEFNGFVRLRDAPEESLFTNAMGYEEIYQLWVTDWNIGGMTKYEIK